MNSLEVQVLFVMCSLFNKAKLCSGKKCKIFNSPATAYGGRKGSFIIFAGLKHLIPDY